MGEQSTRFWAGHLASTEASPPCKAMHEALYGCQDLVECCCWSHLCSTPSPAPECSPTLPKEAASAVSSGLPACRWAMLLPGPPWLVLPWRCTSAGGNNLQLVLEVLYGTVCNTSASGTFILLVLKGSGLGPKCVADIKHSVNIGVKSLELWYNSTIKKFSTNILGALIPREHSTKQEEPLSLFSPK